jgi:rod shape-determining protein MreD
MRHWLKLGLLLFITLVLQTTVFSRLTIFGVGPNLILLLVIVVAVIEDEPVVSLIFAALAGWLQDVFSFGPYLSLFLLVIAATIISVIKQSFSGEQNSLMLILTAIFTPTMILLGYLIFNASDDQPIIWLNLVIQLPIQTLYTLLCLPLYRSGLLRLWQHE